MNEITTEERLRIVEELNRTANDSLGGESLQRALARITGAEDTSWRGVMHLRCRAGVPPDDAGAGGPRRQVPLLRLRPRRQDRPNWRPELLRAVRGGGGLMDTMEDILADCNEVFRYDDTLPQDRAHAYLKEHRVCRGYDDTAMERAAQDMIERAYTVGRMESSKAVARETARIIAEGIAKELGITPGEE